MTVAVEENGLERVPSNVPGLDEILSGGFFAGAVYIVRGAPGAGKTILANQICFNHVQTGGRAVYVTLLAESHARMLQHMQTLSFYDPDPVPRRLYYVSAFNALETDGLKGLMDLLRREIRGQKATLLVLDGLLAVEESSGSDREYRKFIHELQAHAAVENCVALLLTNGSRRDYHPEHTMVDGLITLDDIHIGKRAQRELEVRKFRGSASLRGRHPFRIADDGIVVYPRAEARFGRSAGSEPAEERRTTSGNADLDDMLHGGLLVGTTTVVLGLSGTGKTTLGLHFLAGSSAAEPGLHFGFYETPARLTANAASLGLDFAAPIAAGHLHLLWRAPTEQILDDLAGQIVQAVREHGIKRLFVDGLNSLIAATDLPERAGTVFAALSHTLRVEGVTTVYACESFGPASLNATMPVPGISAIAENLLELRYRERDNTKQRLISLLKVRSSAFDGDVHAFEISGRGLTITGKPSGSGPG